MARSFLPSNVNTNGGVWHNSTAYPGWQWKGDTSSDEVTGHLFVYPLIHDLVAETPAEKSRVKNLIRDITSYIVDNGFMLIDITGKPTSWGRWDPKFLNEDPDEYDDRGVNSMQIISWLLSGYRLFKNESYMDAAKLLVQKYGYGGNIINQKITQPSDYNYSDDELAFLPYYTYIHADQPFVRNEFKLSITRAHKIAKTEKSSLWNIIYGTTGVQEFGLEDAAWCLRTWPLDWIDWPYYNQNRTDYIMSPYISRNGYSRQAMRVFPYDEISIGRWNSNPFDLTGGSGYDESDPSAYLLPYWMARYHGFISAP